VSYGRDRRRRPTKEELLALYERSGGLCQSCGDPLGVDYHNAHLAAYAHGGATSDGQMQAWCRKCNLLQGPQDAAQVEDVILRQWQAQALDPILEQLWSNGAATLHAAPGAGKTLFTGAVFRRLYDAGLVRRLLIVVPNLGLVDQWVKALGEGMRIHLDSAPRDGVFEHPETVGAVFCYHSLPASAAAHATRMEQIPTLVVFDEVHHLSERASWGNAVRGMVGDVANGPPRTAAVLNMTGTLFRSSKSQRISTVRYQRVETDEGERWQAIADWSVPTADLIGVELRSPDLYVYGGQAKLIDLQDEKVVTGDIADLSQRERRAVMRDAYNSKEWLRGYCNDGLRLLKNQLIAVNYEAPLRLLFIANGTTEARLAADMLNEATGQDFARLVISDEPKALRTLRNAAKEPRSCGIVAVQMITEGFDCPEVSTIIYAANKTAPLFVAQSMARAMRITRLERAVGQQLPAQILIPDNPELREAFASALANALHSVEDDAEAVCPRCGFPRPECRCIVGPPPPRMRRFELLDLEDPQLRSATVLIQDDGQVLRDELDYYTAQCEQLDIPEVFAPRIAVISRRGRPAFRAYTPPVPTATPADPRSINRAHRAVLQEAAKWMAGYHVSHDARYATVGAFQAQANLAAGLPAAGGRDQATSEQLAVVAEWMIARVLEHCKTHEEWTPRWATGEAS
jgi:superfamily II DNA or RNA helicase